MARDECDYCEVQDIKDHFGPQWVAGASYDGLLEDLIEQASRLIDRELGWGDCHFAAGDVVASARLFDTQSGYEMDIGRCLNDGLYYTATTISFALANTINDTANGLAGFLAGDMIAVSGSTSGLNDGVYTVTTGGVAGSIVVLETLVVQPAGPSVTISRPAVAVDETGTGAYVAWAGNVHYITWPYNQTYFTRIKIKTGAAKVFGDGQQRLQVTGKWGGITTPPPEVKLAAIITASRWFKRGLQGYQDTGAIIEVGQLTYTKALDPDVVEILSNLPRRIPYG